MAIRRNNKRQENEDEIIEAVEATQAKGDSTQDFFENNKVAILGGIAAIILLAIAFSVYKTQFQEPREAAASEELVHAERQFLQDSFDLALENPGGGYEGLLGIIDSYGGTKAGNLAKYYAAVSYLNLGRFEDAIEYMKDFQPSGSFTPIMKHGIIGDAYGELQDFDAAISSYKKAISNSNELLTPYYANKLGVLMMKQGDTTGAKQYFEMIKKDYPTSNESASAEYYLNQG